jgi:hypothetical protein
LEQSNIQSTVSAVDVVERCTRLTAAGFEVRQEPVGSAASVTASHAPVTDSPLVDAITIDIAPHFIGQRTNFVVALRKVRHTRRSYRPRSDDRGAVFHQRLDFPQDLRRHARALGEHQDLIAHAVGKHEPTFPDTQAASRTSALMVSNRDRAATEDSCAFWPARNWEHPHRRNSTHRHESAL